jgi:pilus assembly protein CpaB
MKFSIFLLVLMGVGAALSASLLTASMRQGSAIAMPAPDKPMVVLTASRPLGPSTVVRAEHLTSRTLARGLATESFYADPVQVIGKVLAMPVSPGQAFTPNCFVHEATGAHLALRLPTGMRAVSLSLTNASSIRGLLYPGCRVDVLVSFKVQRRNESPGEALSTTLLEDIEVLAVEDRVLGTAGQDQEAQTKTAPMSGRNHQAILVTLKVNSRQAEALQLASEYGSLSLAMRNPVDKSPIDKDATMLSEGRLAEMAAMLQASVSADPDEELARWVEEEMRLKTRRDPKKELVETMEAAESPPMWEIMVIRGVVVEKRSYPMPGKN